MDRVIGECLYLLDCYEDRRKLQREREVQISAEIQDFQREEEKGNENQRTLLFRLLQI